MFVTKKWSSSGCLISCLAMLLDKNMFLSQAIHHSQMNGRYSPSAGSHHSSSSSHPFLISDIPVSLPFEGREDLHAVSFRVKECGISLPEAEGRRLLRFSNTKTSVGSVTFICPHLITQRPGDLARAIRLIKEPHLQKFTPAPIRQHHPQQSRVRVTSNTWGQRQPTTP